MIQLMIPTAKGMPRKNNNWHKPCGGRIYATQLAEAGIVLPGLDPDDHLECTREPHPVTALHVNHGVESCTVWGPDDAILELVTRKAVIRSTEGAAIARYLPSNYQVIGTTGAPEHWTIIEGFDNAGWTLDGYVLPRLASGMFYGEEVRP
jgi:hypothetical protein